MSDRTEARTARSYWWSYQQPRGDRDDVGHGVLGGDVLAGLRDVAQHVAVDDGPKDEVDVADQDEGQALLHQPPRPLVLI